MSEERQMKKIALDTLEDTSRKSSAQAVKKIISTVGIVAVLAAGSYGVYRVVSGEVLASRFVVSKMVCPACVLTVKELTGKIPGVVETDVNLAAQDVTVKFRNKQTDPEQIKQAIAMAGYPIRLEGLFSPTDVAGDKDVIAIVNGRPIFRKDLDLGLYMDGEKWRNANTASALFSVIGKEILLQDANSKMVIVQPYEVEEVVNAYMKEKGLSPEEFNEKVVKVYGSQEKLNQILAHRIGIRKLLDDYILAEIEDSNARERKAVQWIGSRFKEADVTIVDDKVKKAVFAAGGPYEWKTFWPLLIGKETELKSALLK